MRLGAAGLRAQELDRAPDDRGHVPRALPEVCRARYQIQLDSSPGRLERLGQPAATTTSAESLMVAAMLPMWLENPP